MIGSHLEVLRSFLGIGRFAVRAPFCAVSRVFQELRVLESIQVHRFVLAVSCSHYGCVFLKGGL